MHRLFSKKRIAIAAGGVVAATLAVAGVATAADVTDTDEPITGEALSQASQAALDHLGEGRVTGTEIDDEDSKYEVEVTLDNGREVDVQLDEDFNVVGSEAESSDEAEDGTDE